MTTFLQSSLRNPLTTTGHRLVRDSNTEDKLARVTVVFLNSDIWCHGKEGHLQRPCSPLSGYIHKTALR